MNAVTFHVPGKPQGKARAKTVRNKHTGNTMSYTPETDLLYENYIKDRFLNKCNGMFLERGKPVTLRIVARFLPPKSTSKKRTALMLDGKELPLKKPDIDNIVKVVADALNGVAYHDDTQIVMVVVPELDTWRLAKYAGYASGNNVVTGAIADGKAGIAAIRAGKTAIKNAEAKTETCYLFISTTLKGMIDDLDTTASKKAMEDWAGVIEVPASRFFDKITLTKTGAGGFATTGGKAIDFLIVDKNAAIQYQKHTVSKIITPEQNQTADAWKFGYRTVGIAEAKDNKKVAIYVHKAGE